MLIQVGDVFNKITVIKKKKTRKLIGSILCHDEKLHHVEGTIKGQIISERLRNSYVL